MQELGVITERLKSSHELVTALSLEVFRGSMMIEQNIGSWREALDDEMNLKHSEGYHKTVGSKYQMRSNLAPYCKSKYLTHLLIVDAKTQNRLIGQFFSVSMCVRLSKMSETFP